MAAQNAKRDENRVTTLIGVDNVGFTLPTTVAVDPATHALLITGSISATNPSVGTNTATAPASSTEIGWIDGSGNLQGVSAINPLPVSATLTNPTIGAGVPVTGNYVAGNKGGTLTGLLIGSQTTANSLAVSIASDQASISTTVTSLIPGVGATNLGKAEDAPHTSGDTGVMMLGVRNDDGSVLAGSNGDYIPITTDSSGALRIDLNGTVSANNSSTATLTSGSTFTGTSDDALIYNEIRITVRASHASATDGLSIQQSPDNSNWDVTDTYTIAAATTATYAVPRQARYIRIVYTNGGTNQTSFRLQTILNRMGTSAQSQRAGDGYTNETDLGQSQSFGMLYNNVTWDRMRSVINATNSTGTGIVAMGSLAQFDDVSPTAITENQFGNMRISSNRNLYSTIRDAAGNERGLNISSGGNISVDTVTTLSQFGGNAINLGTGNTGTGTLRVVLATDQPQLTNKLLVTPDANSSVNLNQLAGNTISSGVGASGTGTLRVVGANNEGRTLVSTGGSVASSGNNTLVAAGTNKLKVYAFSLSTTSTSSTTCIFQSGASGTELWRVVLQAATSTNTGANLSIPVPSYLFATASATLLNLNLSGANTIHWSVAYFDET